jgi:hypothetical protein
LREAGFAREGVYVGIAPQFDATLDGDSFDGETVYQEIGGTETAILPRLDEKASFRVAVGFRSRPLALEFSYDRRSHSGTFVDEPIPAVYQAVNVDGRFFFLTSRRLQPHAVIGISFPLLTVEDGSVDDLESPTPSFGDARWRGTGLNTEIGVTAFVTPRIGISIGYAYRPIWFTTLRGVTDRPLELRPRFRETSANFVLMAFATF